MLQKLLYLITFGITLLLYLFLNGNIQFTSDPIPPLGKFMSPFSGAWTSDTRSEHASFDLHINGLKDKVEIMYDEHHIPHIFAQNMEDALFAQGYTDAQNRLFQMEFLSKLAAGELSSFIGPKTLHLDRDRRRRGMKYAAENAVKGWENQPNYDRLLRYVDGINTYIKSLHPKDYPLEYKLFNIHPEKWTPLKTALIFKQMSLTLAGRNEDISSTNLVNILGKETFEFLYPIHQNIENAVIPTERPYQFDTLYGSFQDTSGFLDKPILKTYYEGRAKGVGSNSWGLSGSKTTTGKPIFCNDPHLSLTLPSIWIEAHLRTPEFNAYGVSFPGFPGIMIGFNEYIAWGETNVSQDVEDLFRIDWANKERTKYVLDGKEQDVTLRYEEIKIKGQKSLIDTIKYTYWGPIYHTSDDGTMDLAMRWICHDVPDTDEFNTFIDAMTCKNYDEYLASTARFISPAQNFGAASKDGDIGMRVNGRFPAKRNEDGRFVEEGNNSKNNWQDWIPRDQNPQIRNPERGFISSANQVSADKTYPYYYNGKFERYRNVSINQKLNEISKASPEDMKKMQYNDVSLKAAQFVSMLKNTIQSDDIHVDLRDLYSKLTTWDFSYKADKVEPIILEKFVDTLHAITWDEINTLKKEMDVKYPEDWRLLELIVNDPTNAFFDIKSTPKSENAHDIVLKAITYTLQDVANQISKSDKVTWGQYKPLNIFHVTRLPALSEMNIPADGCADAINATAIGFGPSWRMVISLEDKPKGMGVYPGGQSGNPASKYYKNMIADWLNGNYHSLNIDATATDLRKSAHSIIQLNPEK